MNAVILTLDCGDSKFLLFTQNGVKMSSIKNIHQFEVVSMYKKA
jgi:hypothetical protein